MTTTTPKKKKKSNAGLIVAGVATAAVVGGGLLLFSRDASAKSGGGTGPGGDGSGSGGAGGSGGSGGPGGNIPGSGGGGGGGSNGGSSRPKGGGQGKGARDGVRRQNDPSGYWWGDRSKIPADFDFQSNRIWISPDRTAAAAGFYFFVDGQNEAGERIKYDEDGIGFMLADGTILYPTKDADHREDAVPNLKKILDKPGESGDLTHSVFSWVAAYYGNAISPLEAATSKAIDLTQDMVDEASVLSGGRRGPIDLNGPLRTFYAYAAERLDMGRQAIYGDGFLWGQGEDALS